ncbi:MAG: sulfoxide reductase heme-binding subunit YedZ [Anaerolineaceae bacterium]|nr:sulfoxide reductase heme-binding subunit YedZ [Anaerolineaceae bacterium]
MRVRHIFWFMVIMHAGCLIPLAWLGAGYFFGRLGADPISALEQFSGRIAISLLTATLLVHPLASLLKQPLIMKARRPLGLYTFAYVLLHVLILVGLDYRLDIPLLVTSYVDKPFIWFGAATSLILAALAITSFAWWRQRMGVWWGWLHRLIYLAALLDLAHFFLVVKGNLLSLSGNLARPSIYAALILLLLLLRLPVFRHHPCPDISTHTDDT